VKHNTKLIC